MWVVLRRESRRFRVAADVVATCLESVVGNGVVRSI